MNRRIPIILSLIFLLVSVCTVVYPKENLIKKAHQSMDFTEYERAIGYFDQALSANPNQKDVRAHQGFAYFRLGKYEDAIRVLKEELTLFPDNLNASILLGYIYFHQEKYEEAAKLCQEFDELLEKALREEAKKKKLDLKSKKGMYEFKENYEYFFDKVRKKNPNLGLPYFVLGFLHKKRGNFDKAEENFNEAIKKGYSSVDCKAQLIDIELIRENWQEGLAKSRIALQIEDSKSDFYFLMGYAYYHLGEIERAVYCFENAFKLRPYEVEAAKNLGKIYFNQNEFKKATPLFKRVLNIIPFDYEAMFLLDRSSNEKSIQKKEDKPTITKNIVDRVDLEYKYDFRSDINHIISVMNESAFSLLRSGHLGKAIGLIRIFLEIHDLSPDLNYNLANFYRMNNDLGKAIKYAWRAAELKEDFRDAYDLIGNIFFRLQDYENSIIAYKKVMDIGPKDALSHYNLGCVYSAMGDLDNAEESWKNAISGEKVRKVRKEEKASEDELTRTVTVFKASVSAKAHDGLGRLYLQRNQSEKALEHFEKAVEIEPGKPDLYYEIGKIYLDQKNTKKAVYHFERYLYLGGKEEAKVKEILESIK
ncbi:MAG: tetratricopeptide repeat protein [Candidatus Aminicenantes bacterium]|nr:tetratricopeptide repeat protein [Candidatus Aminicenantes bacterium]